MPLQLGELCWQTFTELIPLSSKQTSANTPLSLCVDNFIREA